MYKLHISHRAAIILAAGCVPADIDSDSLRCCNSSFRQFVLDDPDHKFLDACESMVCTFPPLVKGGQSLRLPVNIEIRKQINALRRPAVCMRSSVSAHCRQVLKTTGAAFLTRLSSLQSDLVNLCFWRTG